MIKLSDYPQLVFVISFFVLSLSGSIGANFLRKLRKWDEGKREDFRTIMGATLTLLGITASWGSTFFLIKDLLDRIPTLDFLAIRFAIAATLSGPTSSTSWL